MKDKKNWFYIALCLIGIFAIAGGLLHNQIAKFLIPGTWMVTSYAWVIALGIISTIAGLILLFSKSHKVGEGRIIKATILETVLIIVLIISVAGAGGWLYGQYQKTLLVSTENIQRMSNHLKMMEVMEKDNPFYCKKVIIRDDDIGDSDFLPSLEWIANLAMEKNIKVTFAIIPATLVNNPEIVDYLNQLDKKHFEFATHGYEHIHFAGLSYGEQVSLIKKGTDVMREILYCRPYTFVPPHGSGDVNTSKACRLLGYHTITDMLDYPSYMVDFTSDFEYEARYHPPEHRSFEDFKGSFDSFYNSSDGYFLVYLHDWTFLDEEGKLDETKAHRFEKVIDYMKNKNVQFLTIEEAYRWHIDENVIRTGMVNKSHYFIDLGECRYNHTIKFSPPSNWDGNIALREATTGKEIMFKNVFEFKGVKGHLYEIYEVQSVKNEEVTEEKLSLKINPMQTR